MAREQVGGQGDDFLVDYGYPQELYYKLLDSPVSIGPSSHSSLAIGLAQRFL